MLTQRSKATLIIAIVTFLIFLPTNIIAASYTYDGPIDPVIFHEWTQDETFQPQFNQEFGFLANKLINPDPDAKIKKAFVFFIYGRMGRGAVMSYEYEIDGKMHRYTIDMVSDHFTEIKCRKKESQKVPKEVDPYRYKRRDAA